MLTPVSPQRPRTLLRIDAAGASISAGALGTFAGWFWWVVGMPRDVLAMLAALPLVFVLYDLICLRTDRADRPASLRPIAAANLGYCALSATMLGIHARSLTALGWAYFVGEVAIVTGLAIVQLRRARDRPFLV